MDQETRDQEQANQEVSRRDALSLAAKLGIGGAALASTLGAGDITSAFASSSRATMLSGKYKFVLINHVTTNSFFSPTKVGAQDACNLLGCTYQWTGSQNSIASEMTSAINTAVNQGADGIGIPLVSTDFQMPVQNALSKGIPVIAYNADDAKNKRLGYIGQDLFLSGQAMGKQIAANVPSGSHIGLFIATPGQSNIQPRIDGAIQAIKASGKSITYDVITSGAAETAEYSAVESYYLGHTHVKGLFAVDGGSTTGVALTSKKHGLAKSGKVYCGGFDLDAVKIKSVAAGDLDFTIDQQPYLQGFYTIVQLFLYKKSGGLMFPSNTNTGLKFVTKANVKPYQSASHFE